jgi:hypothetical protein
MEVEVSECADSGYWDTLLERSHHATVFHTWECLKLIEKHSGTKLRPLVGKIGTNEVGMMPVFVKRRRGVTMAFSPPPKAGLTYLGPLFVQYDKTLKQQTVEKVLLSSMDSFDHYIKERIKPNFYRMTLGPGYVDARPLSWNGYSVAPEYTYVADLSGGEESIFDNYQKQVRVDIRKAQREGVVVKEGGKEELKSIYGLLADRFLQQGLRTGLTLGYLSELYDLLNPKNLRIFFASHGGEFVAGFICICHRDRASYWAGGGKTDMKGIYPNDVLQWEAMRWAIGQGFKRYEIVDAGDERLRHFKSKFNPNLVIWFRAEKYSPPILRHLEYPLRKMSRHIGLGPLS